MTKTTKLYISDKLELRYSAEGWPEMPTHNSMLHDYGAQTKMYNAALAKAKEDSILVDDLRIKMVVMKDAKRDSFVDYPGEMEVIQDCRFGCKHDGYNCENTPSCGIYRIARMKPVNSATDDLKLKEFPTSGLGLKARILDAFAAKYALDDRDATEVLNDVIDELGIK